MREILNRVRKDAQYRTQASAWCSFGMNLIYAAYNALLAVNGFSYWFLTMGVYYALLGFGRIACLSGGLRHGREKQAHIVCGVVLSLLTVVLIETVVLSFQEQVTRALGLIPMIVMATYTFSRMTVTIVSLARARKRFSPLFATMYRLSLADAATAMLTLTRVMLLSQSAGAEFTRQMIAVAGLLATATDAFLSAASFRTGRMRASKPR